MLRKLIKKSGLIVVLAMGILPLNAQELAYQKGDIDFNLGIGLGGVGRYTWAQNFPVGMLASVDYGAHEFWSAGLEFGYQRVKYEYNYWVYQWEYAANYIAIGGRGSAHIFPILSAILNKDIGVDGLDTYLSVHTGFLAESVTQRANTYNGYYYDYTKGLPGSRLYFGPSIGAKYMVSKFFGFYGEVGQYPLAYGVNGGITFKF